MQLYNELRRVASKYYPQEYAYCTVIAVAVATGSSFGKARSMMFNHARRINRKGSSVLLVHATLEKMGYNAKRIEYKSKTLISIQREFKNRKGTFFVYTARHVTCIKDGVCEDWSNNEDGRPTRYSIESVYEITK